MAQVYKQQKRGPISGIALPLFAAMVRQLSTNAGTIMAADIRMLSAVIASEIKARPEQAKAAIELLDEGATVPFIARYRKEVTGGLDDTQLRNLAERLVYLRELESRRDTIVDSINGQGKMTTSCWPRSRAPPPRPSSRISICPTSRSAAPAPKSPASAASGRWPRRSFRSRARCRRRWPKPTSPPTCPT
jgi:hypothetical protein